MQPQPRTWPVLSGAVPALAAGYTRRPETGAEPWDTLRQGRTVILGPDLDLAGRGGGTGKTQLAAAFAARLWAAAEVDLLVWLDAGSRDSIVSGYARALADIRVAARPGEPEAAAARFLTWLAETGRRWLVVLDGLADSANADGLWPCGPSGQAVVTTGLTGLTPKLEWPATATREPPPAAPELSPIAVPGFSQREAVSYMSARLNDDPYQAAGSLDLAIALECRPAGLALAVAYLLDSGQDCRRYRLAWGRYRQDLAGGPSGDPLAPLWMLAVDRARQFSPPGLAWPALKLAAVLGPARIPGAVLTSAAACAYVTGRRIVTNADQASLRAAFGNLQRLGLVSIEPEDSSRTVWMLSALQSSVRQAMGAAELRRTVRAAADAVHESWPAEAASADLEQALRDCATSLRRCDDLALWDRGCHPLLLRLGASLDDGRMAETAVRYWRDLAGYSTEFFGTRDPLTLRLRERLASAVSEAGRAEEVIALREELAADVDAVCGPTHPQAVTSRASLARALRAAGRLDDAISLAERVAADSDLVFGAIHERTAAILAELGGVYDEAGRHPEAIGVLRRCLTQRAQTIGLMHPETMSVRRQLAEVYRHAGRARDAIRLYEDALAQVEGAVGAAHPDAVTAQEDVAMACYHAGRSDEAAAAFERVLADWQRVPGASAEDSIAARANLAAIYCLSGRLKEAIRLYESALADLDRFRGPAHRDTLRTRWNLAAALHKAKRVSEAIEHGEATLADCERSLGPGHWETLTSRANLAHAYHAAGLLKRASAQFDRALRDCERSLGPDDSLTEAVRVLRKRYLAGRQGAAPIIAPPTGLPHRIELERLPGSPLTGAARAGRCSATRRHVSLAGARMAVAA